MDDRAYDDAELDRLCEFCASCLSQAASYIQDSSRSYEVSRQNRPVHDFVSSVKEGCHCCNLIVGRLPLDVAQLLLQTAGDNEPELHHQFEYRIEMLRYPMTKPPRVRCTFIGLRVFETDDHQDKKPAHNNLLTAQLSIQKPADLLGPLVRRKDRLSCSENSLEQIRLWLADCDHSADHVYCQRMMDVMDGTKLPQLPERLLDLGPDKQQTTVSLKSTKDLRQNLKYATLSHCWGGQCVMTLTRQNLKRFEEGVEILSFPKTFRDAMIVAKNLELRYLWIDALCIIQDSHGDEDWLRQAPGMGGVYANSYVTLAATSSTDSVGGLIYDRSPLTVYYCECFKEGDCEDSGSLVLRFDPFNVGGNVELKATAFFDRGWVFQERILSRRMIHFTAKTVYWECFSKSASQEQPNITARPSIEIRPEEKCALGHALVDMSSLPAEQSPARILDLWRALREEYSTKAFTNVGDRLVALAGVAQTIHQLLRSPAEMYIVGLWRPHILMELLWISEPMNLSLPFKDDNIYIGPSWSWISVNGAIRFLLTRLGIVDMGHELIEILDIDVDLVSGDYGLAKCAILRVWAFVLPVVMIRTSRSAWNWTHEVKRVHDAPADWSTRVYFDHSDITEIDGVEVERLIIPLLFWRPDALPRWHGLIGFVVQEVSSSPNTYRRLGLLRIDLDSLDEVMAMQFLRSASPTETLTGTNNLPGRTAINLI